jgi:pyrimidine deaminase RibD-like protein
MSSDHQTKQFLDLAARVASRAFGHAEPNPMVGAVIVKDNQIIGIGHHRRFGDVHAERDAINASRTNGHEPPRQAAPVHRCGDRSRHRQGRSRFA